MSPIHGSWRALLFIAALFTLLACFLITKDTWQEIWKLARSDAMEENVRLRNEIDQLKSQIAYLKNENLYQNDYIETYAQHIGTLIEANQYLCRYEPLSLADLLEGLTKETIALRQTYLEMLNEKLRWDRYQQEKYRNVLESTVEPVIINVYSLVLNDEENREYFIELANALALHRRLIRDVRLFHDEVQYQKKQHQMQQAYDLYDLKFQLAPFARESALADAMQQAMSALSAGIYQHEALEVLDRIGDEFAEPIQNLYGQGPHNKGTLSPTQYDYNLYTVFGKKLMDYADNLTQQSVITLGPTVLGELDYFNQQLYENLFDLYEVGQNEAIDPSKLNLDELEHVLYYRD